MTTEYLVYHGDKWHIAYPGAIEDDTQPCDDRSHDARIECPTCHGIGRVRSKNRTIRLAWFERDHSMICFDYDEPDVKRLPE